MPFTPFHLGPAILLGLVFFGYVDFPTFLIANIIIDIEAFLVLTLNLRYPVHGFLHSFLGGGLSALILVAVMKKLRASLSPLLRFWRLEQKESLRSMVLASFSGVYLHVLLDSPLYSEMRPFYPLDINPFLSGNALIGSEIYRLCIVLFMGGMALYVVRLISQRRKR